MTPPRWSFSRTVSVGNLLTIAAGIGVCMGGLWAIAAWKEDVDRRDAGQTSHIMAIEKAVSELDRRMADQFMAVNINLAEIKARLPVQHAEMPTLAAPASAR